MSFGGMRPVTMETRVEEILEQLLWLEAGLVRPQYVKSDVNELLAKSGLTPEEQRVMKRKFRKAWRKLARVTPKHFVQRMRDDNDPKNSPVTRKHIFKKQSRLVRWTVQPGAAPRQQTSEERKRLVCIHFASRARKLVDQFTGQLTAHETV